MERGLRRARGGKVVNTIDILVRSSSLNSRRADSAKKYKILENDGAVSSFNAAALNNQRKMRTTIVHTRSDKTKGESLADSANNTMDEVDEALGSMIDGARGKRPEPPIYRRVINITDAQQTRAPTTAKAGGRRGSRRRR